MPSRPVGHRGIVSPATWLMLWLVKDQAGYALDLTARYDSLFSVFLPFRDQAHSLKRLEELGLVDLAPQPQQKTRQRGRRVYLKATPAGQAAHQRWLNSEVKHERWRTELLARIYTGASLGVDGLTELLRAYRDHVTIDARQIDLQVSEIEAARRDDDLTTLCARIVLLELQMTIRAQREATELALRVLDRYTQRPTGDAR